MNALMAEQPTLVDIISTLMYLTGSLQLAPAALVAVEELSLLSITAQGRNGFSAQAVMVQGNVAFVMELAGTCIAHMEQNVSLAAVGGDANFAQDKVVITKQDINHKNRRERFFRSKQSGSLLEHF